MAVEMHPVVMQIAEAVDRCDVTAANLLVDGLRQHQQEYIRGLLQEQSRLNMACEALNDHKDVLLEECSTLKAELATARQALSDAEGRPQAVLEWARDTFGEIAIYLDERCMRFVEEALELAQAMAIPRETLDKILDRVYGRPAGSIEKEIAQSGMTLEALAAATGNDLNAAIDGEFKRVRGISKEEFARRHAVKVDQGVATAPPERTSSATREGAGTATDGEGR